MARFRRIRLRTACTYGRAARIINGAVFALLLALAVPPAVSPSHAASAEARETPVIVAFGDSLSAGYGLEDDDSFPVQLERALRAKGVDVKVINSGVSGDTTAGGRARLAWSLPPDADLVILELGANDGLRGIDPAETRANLDAILRELAARDTEVLFTGMLAPPNLGREYGEAFNGLFPDLATAHEVVFYPFFLDGVAAEKDLNQPDGIHPNAEGVARIVDGITPYVLKALAQSGVTVTQ